MNRPSRPFTLLVLAALCSVLRLASCGPSTEDAKAQVGRDLGHLRLGLLQYAKDKGAYPESLEILETSGYPKSRKGAAVSRDPWNRPYRYERSGKSPRVVCYGSDDEPGGSGAASDASTTLPTR